MLLAIAQFIRCYGAGTFRGGWPTRDGVIPWALFWALYTQIPRLAALERIHESTAVAHGIAVAFSGTDPRVQAFQRRELAEAFPGEAGESLQPRMIENRAAKRMENNDA